VVEEEAGIRVGFLPLFDYCDELRALSGWILDVIRCIWAGRCVYVLCGMLLFMVELGGRVWLNLNIAVRSFPN